MAYSAEPFAVLWCRLSNGSLVGFTYNPEQDVTGWHRHPLGASAAGVAVVESISVTPAPDGLSDELWMIVRRTIDGTTKRYIEYMARPWEGADSDGTAGDAQENAFYVDCGLTYSGAPATTISGLDHLDGEAVQILADGATHPARTVSGGEISLQSAASTVHVGLKAPARMITTAIEAGGPSGTSQGKAGRIYRIALHLIDTLGGFFGVPGAKFTDPSTLDEIDYRVPDDFMDAAPPIFSGIVDLTFPGDWDSERRVEIRQDDPLPMTIVAIAPRLHVNDR